MAPYSLRSAVRFAAALAVLNCNDQPSWHRVRSEAGRYTVTMPGVVRTSVQAASSVYGRHDVFFTVSISTGVTYAVMYVDIPVGALAQPRAVLDRAVESAMDDFGATLQTATASWISEFEGREFQATNLRGHPLFGRVYLVGARLYRLSVSGLNQRASAESADRFFGSFELRLAAP